MRLKMNLIAAVAFSVVAICRAQTYDSLKDFSIHSNPNGVWSYGWSKELTSEIHLYENTTVNCGVQTWLDNKIQQYSAPHVLCNPTDAAACGYLPHATYMHPGPNKQFSHCIWTAPQTGSYKIEVTFTARDTGAPHVYVLQNGSVLGDSLVDQGTPHPFTFGPLTLWTGDKIDAAVGVGLNKAYSGDDTQFAFVITKVK